MKSIIFDNSEMAKKIREFDWSQTPVGALENWPQSLQHHVNSLLATLFPTILFWGANLTVCAYNDAYRPLLGRKSEPLGRSFFEVWREAEEIIKPKIDQALQGEACYYRNAPFMLVRFGKPDQAYFDYCFSPIRDETGSIKGVLNTAVEVTERKKAEDALQNQTQTLQQKVAERTAEAEKRSWQLQALAVALIETERRERERISNLLHENYQQDLTAVRMILEMMRSMDGGRTKFDETILRCRDILNEVIQKSHKLCHDLNPPALRSTGLLMCLDGLVDDMRENYGLDVELKHSADAEPESYSVASFLYQALKELLLNVLKHSGASTAQINIREKDGWIVVQVADSGKGDDLNQVYARRGIEPGFGLFSIDEWVRSLGGRMTIETIPGDGWVTTLTVPRAEAAGKAGQKQQRSRNTAWE
ncbi:MAG: PAS domain-containing protein [Desulfotignum sp.]|nr:PAS domain-containing protein [Desulfotignum sp.]